MPKTYPPEENARIIKLRMQGKRPIEIAKIIGRPKKGIEAFLSHQRSERGLVYPDLKRGQIQKYSKETIAKWCDLRRQRVTNEEIGKQYGAHPTFVSRKVTEYLYELS